MKLFNGQKQQSKGVKRGAGQLAAVRAVSLLVALRSMCLAVIRYLNAQVSRTSSSFVLRRLVQLTACV